MNPVFCSCFPSFFSQFMARKGLMAWNLLAIFFSQISLQKLLFCYFAPDFLKKLKLWDYFFLANILYCKGCNQLKQLQVYLFSWSLQNKKLNFLWQQMPVKKPEKCHMLILTTVYEYLLCMLQMLKWLEIRGTFEIQNL